MIENSSKLWELLQVQLYLLQCPEPAHALEVSQRDHHLGLVVRVLVYIGKLAVKLLCQLLVWVGL